MARHYMTTQSGCKIEEPHSWICPHCAEDFAAMTKEDVCMYLLLQMSHNLFATAHAVSFLILVAQVPSSLHVIDQAVMMSGLASLTQCRLLWFLKSLLCVYSQPVARCIHYGAYTLRHVMHKIVVPNIGMRVCNTLHRDCKGVMSEQNLRDCGAVYLVQHLCYNNKPMLRY